MPTLINSSTTSSIGPLTQTPIGDVPVSSLNKWNNTAFSQLCLQKSDSELAMFAHCPELGTDKQLIAEEKLAAREYRSGNQF